MTAGAVRPDAAPAAVAPAMPTDLCEPHGAAIIGHGPYDARFPVSAFASASVATFATAVAELVGGEATPLVDARLASAWFDRAVRPREAQPSPWHPLSGDYRAADRWVRLHMNVPAHRAAALEALGVSRVVPEGEPPHEPDRNEVAAAVEGWSALELEEAVVAAGGCAAALRSANEWAEHPQGRAVAEQPLVTVERGERSEREWPAGSPERPLAGVRVLDLTRVIAGPVATRALALLGADVLRLDPPDWEEPALEPDITLGKRCARLDAHEVEGAATLAALIAESHVLVHGLRPGALDALGLDAATRASLRPGLVEVQVSAYGPTGPWAERRGFDSLVQLVTGIADARGETAPDAAPVALPVQALDHATGWLAATAVVRGISHARATGEGSASHVSLARTAHELQRMAGERADSETAPPPAPVSARDADDAEFPAHPVDTAWGVVDVLAAPFSIAGVRVEALQPPRPLGSDDPDWAPLDAPARRERTASAVSVPRRRVPVWAALSGLLVWAGQGVPLTLGGAMLGTAVPNPGWWTSPVWAAGAAAQAVALLLTWFALSRVTNVVGVLAATIPLGMLAHVSAATAVALATGAASPPALDAGLNLLALHWASGAALIAASIPILLMLTPLGAGAGALNRRAFAPRYARRGRGRRAA
ncbi:CoA transferase family III [Microcella alkaliphila]|uniref:CoA transferase family III n=1 Tax=Microcella alkaliphila TaxID=279828 RepID=A0A4Q7TPQ4_9MICO|nr:CoA transferase [Microcella alkaliphila]RZT62287.1 CoA transferase family III [Microcella alkaliphila]